MKPDNYLNLMEELDEDAPLETFEKISKSAGRGLPAEAATSQLLPGRLDWQTFQAGETFEVPANSSFKLKLKVPVDYCCSYS
jgi:hypothetical protein